MSARFCSMCREPLPEGRKNYYCTGCATDRHAVYRLQNLERCRAINRKWNKEHPEVVKAAMQRYNAKKRGSKTD